MPRVAVYTDRKQTAGPQTESFDHIEASRGSLPLPFAPLIGSPRVAVATADLGSALKSGALSDRVRELVIAATAWERDCRFEWGVHSEMAAGAGVGDATLGAIREGQAAPAGEDADLVQFVRSACRAGSVPDDVFENVVAAVGERGVVEVVALIGYYSYIALVMSVLELE